MTRHSFTLTELLVVIAIIVILAGILITGAGYAARRGDEAKAKSAMLELGNALDKYRSEAGYYPPCTTASPVKLIRNSNDQLYLAVGSDNMPRKFFDKKNKKDYMGIDNVPQSSMDFVVKITATEPKKKVDERKEKEKKIKDEVEAKAIIFEDPWGNAFYYKCPGTHNKTSYDLWSYGPDGKSSFDDEKLDDVTNWGTAQ